MSKTLVERERVEELETALSESMKLERKLNGGIAKLQSRITELESVLKGKCPKCGEDMESSCYGQSTSCYSCEYVLQGLGGSDG